MAKKTTKLAKPAKAKAKTAKAKPSSKKAQAPKRIAPKKQVAKPAATPETIADITFAPAVKIAPQPPEVTSTAPPTAPAKYGLSASVVALINALGAKKGASRIPNKPERITLMSAIEGAKANGAKPPPLCITSKANGSYAKHAQRLYDLAMAGDITSIKCMELPAGQNTYAKALRNYRDALIQTTTGA